MTPADKLIRWVVKVNKRVKYSPDSAAALIRSINQNYDLTNFMLELIA